MNHEELLRVIDQLVQSGQTTLDLGAKALSALPPEIGRLTRLKVLLLHNNQLRALPPELAKLTGLEVLGLGGNGLEQLPREVVALNNLTDLYLDGNRLIALPPEIGQLTRLRKLDLARNQVSGIPAEIAKLTGLRFLGLGSNRLVKLPREIGQLENLEELYLDRNQLAVLPPEVFRLRNLATLYLGANPLKGLPPELEQLGGLRKLDLADLDLSELPTFVTRLASMETLFLDNNRLTSFPAEIGRLAKLVILFAGRNRLTKIPPEIGRLINLQKLGLAFNQLTELPPEIGELRSLSKLYLDRNRLAQLPPAIGRLTGLTTLDLAVNQLESLPPEFGDLSGLRKLGLGTNRLAQLPPWVGRLAQLEKLYLDNNLLAGLPPEIGRLTELRELGLGTNRLGELPPEIGGLAKLEELYLDRNRLAGLPPELGLLTGLKVLGLGTNRLTQLPKELGRLTTLTDLYVDNNPLDESFKGLAGRGLGELLAYLRSLEEASEPLYEAKLVFVGEGGVGKTTLLAALRGEPFVENRVTTHGVEVERRSLELDHPDHPGRKIKLNAWDFGGQPVYRITHQFFFSRRALYLLLWHPRLGAEQCDVEGWIQRIKLRVGEEARILIVATHCQSEGRIARIDEARLRRDYGDAIVDFPEVDSKNGYGLNALKGLIARTAAGLPQMGDPLNPRWKASRDEVLAVPDPRVPFGRFAHICARHGLSGQETGTLGALMGMLGWVVYYADDEGLKDELVLRPQWLAKAIGFVLEDRETNRQHGLLEHRRLRQIWYDHGVAGRDRYDPAVHPFFLRLMEKFDISYRLEDVPGCSLVAQLVPEVQPELPWHSDEPPAPPDDRAELRLVCRMKQSSPGLVPWMTVRTHRFATGKYWQRGVFLDHKEHGEAVLELREAGLNAEFTITVRAAYPVYFMSVLQDTLTYLIDQRWRGLKYRLLVPCPE
jgi:Leucine-rich repeat (LRR) protein